MLLSQEPCLLLGRSVFSEDIRMLYIAPRNCLFADRSMCVGQLKWRWFKENRPLQDIVIYDSASRGPLGALTLIYLLGLRHPLSSIGALITIFMLVIDPFAQQIIRYYGCSQEIQGRQASVPRTNLFQSDNNFLGLNGQFVQVSIPSDLQSAINAGIFSPGGHVPFDCPTGNCTLDDPYSTIGYCSRCIDTTSDLEFDTVLEDDTLEDGDVLSYLPSGTSINAIGPTSDYTTDIDHLLNVATMDTNHYSRSDWHERSIDWVDIIVAKNPNVPAIKSNCEAESNDWRCKGYGAANCTLYPCVRTCKRVFFLPLLRTVHIPKLTI